MLLVHLCYSFTSDQQRTSEEHLPGECSSSTNAPAYSRSEVCNQHTLKWVDPGSPAPGLAPAGPSCRLHCGSSAAPPHQRPTPCKAPSMKELCCPVRNSPFLLIALKMQLIISPDNTLFKHVLALGHILYRLKSRGFSVFLKQGTSSAGIFVSQKVSAFTYRLTNSWTETHLATSSKTVSRLHKFLYIFLTNTTVTCHKLLFFFDNSCGFKCDGDITK